MISFSIIIPFYNTASKYIIGCINSALNQSYDNYEIILVNDGSTKQYDFSKSNRLTIIDSIYFGVSHARNLGIHNSKGEYIIFLDSDDQLLENTLLNYKDYIQKQGEKDIILSRNHINSSKEINYCNIKQL